MIYKQGELIRHLQTELASAKARSPAAPPQLLSPPNRNGMPPAADDFGLIGPFGTGRYHKEQRAWRPNDLVSDRRKLGGFDARFHSTSAGATPRDFRVLPARIILVRNGESYEGDDQFEYSSIPDPRIPLTDVGRVQAREHTGFFWLCLILPSPTLRRIPAAPTKLLVLNFPSSSTRILSPSSLFLRWVSPRPFKPPCP